MLDYMTCNLLEHLTANFKMFHGKLPSSRRHLVEFTSETVDLGITKLYEMLGAEFEAYGVDGYKPSVKRICSFLGESPEDVFGLPPQIEQTYDNVEKVVFRPPPQHLLAIRRLVDKLRDKNERMATVIEMRFGLVDGQEHTLEEIGQMFGLTRERIRQIEAKAMRFLKTHAVRNGDSGSTRRISIIAMRRKIEASDTHLRSLGIAV